MTFKEAVRAYINKTPVFLNIGEHEEYNLTARHADIDENGCVSQSSICGPCYVDIFRGKTLNIVGVDIVKDELNVINSENVGGFAVSDGETILYLNVSIEDLEVIRCKYCGNQDIDIKHKACNNCGCDSELP